MSGVWASYCWDYVVSWWIFHASLGKPRHATAASVSRPVLGVGIGIRTSHWSSIATVLWCIRSSLQCTNLIKNWELVLIASMKLQPVQKHMQTLPSYHQIRTLELTVRHIIQQSLLNCSESGLRNRIVPCPTSGVWFNSASACDGLWPRQRRQTEILRLIREQRRGVS